MAVTYAQVVSQAAELSPAERWRLVTEILNADSHPQKSALDYFGVNGPIVEDVDARIRDGRDE